MTQEIFDEVGTLVSAKTEMLDVKGEPTPSTKVVFIPTNAKGKAVEGIPRSGFQKGLVENGGINVLKTIAPGGDITLKVTLNGIYKNIVGIVSGHVDNPKLVPFTPNKGVVGSKSISSGSGSDYNTRAAVGQAFNLSMEEARITGTQDNEAHILNTLLPKYIRLGALAQKTGGKILEALNSPNQPVAAVAVPTQGVPIATTAPVYAAAATPDVNLGDDVHNLF